jgi:cytochrome c5
MTEVYQAYRNGEIARSELPDIRDVFPDDPERLAEMGFATKPGASGEEVLLEACSMCHNEHLDQSLPRAQFRANLEGGSRYEKDRAIVRLRLPISDIHAMPPVRTRTLSAEARERAIDVLMR